MKRRVFLAAGVAGAASVPWAFKWFASGETHLRLMSNGVDYVIAQDIKDARMIVAEVYGYGPTLSPTEIQEIDWDGWVVYPADRDFEVQQKSEIQTRTVAAWISDFGRGYFAHFES